MRRPPKFLVLESRCSECQTLHRRRIVNYAWLAYQRARKGVGLCALAQRGRISAPTLCLFEQGTYKAGPTARILRVYRSVLP